MEIFQPSLKRAKEEATKEGAFDFGGISFGIGLVMGYRCLLHGMFCLLERMDPCAFN